MTASKSLRFISGGTVAARAWLRLLLLALLIASFGAVGARAGAYKLGAMDQVRIRIAEWQTAQGTFRDWSSISGDYTVGPSGHISLPFVGEVPAAGKTTAEVAGAIGQELQQKLGLLDLPSASVEVIQFRPVFLAGDVETPGKYPYEPGLTVMKAISLAGGLRHSSDSGQRYERDFIKAKGDYEVNLDQQRRLLATKARLEAETAGKSSIDLPKELGDAPNAHGLLQDQLAIMAPRNEKFRLQLTSLDDLKTLLQNEITSLDKKSVAQNRQLDLAKQDLTQVGSLADKGLAVNARMLAVAQQVADLEGKVLDIDTASLQAKQDINKAEQDETTARTDRATELAQDLQDTNAQLEQVGMQIAVAKGLMLEAATKGGASGVTAGGTGAVDAKYTIIRDADGKQTSIAADENAPVLPGDVVKVEFNLTPM